MCATSSTVTDSRNAAPPASTAMRISSTPATNEKRVWRIFSIGLLLSYLELCADVISSRLEVSRQRFLELRQDASQLLSSDFESRLITISTPCFPPGSTKTLARMRCHINAPVTLLAEATQAQPRPL